MKPKTIISISLCLYLLLAAGHAPEALAAPPQGKRYVDKKAGFRLQLPPRWRKDKKLTKQTPGALAAFTTRDESIALAIMRMASSQSAEEMRIALEKVYAAVFPGFRKLSEESAVVSGLSTRKLVFAATFENEDVRIWLLILSGSGEHWIFLAFGPEQLLGSADAEGYQQVQQLIDSFEFLEPVLSRMKAGSPALGETLEATTVAEGGKRYFINDRVGIRILLPPDWIMESEQQPSFEQPTLVVLGKPGSMAKVVLMRELLEGSPELYVKLAKKNANENMLGYQLISEETVSRGGLEGRRLVVTGKERDIAMRYWMEIFSAGEEHFRISAFAPEEVFGGYPDTFNEMMTSVEFPGLSNRLPAALAPTFEQLEVPLAETKPEGGQEQKQTELEELKQAVVQNPADPEARMALGMALVDAGNIEGATTEYEAAARLALDNPLVLIMLGAAYGEKGLHEEAISSVKRALELNPDISIGHFLLGSIYFQQELHDEAIDSYRNGLKLDPDYLNAHTGLAAVYMAKGLHDDAIASLKKAVKLKPDSHEARLVLGLAYQGKGRNDRALASYRKAIELKPDYDAAYVNRLVLALSLEDTEEAVATFKSWSQANPAGISTLEMRFIRRLLNQAGELEYGGDARLEIHETLDRVEYSPPNPLVNTESLQVEHARLLLERGRVADAARCLEGVVGVEAHIEMGADRAFDPVRDALGDVDLVEIAEKEIEEAIAAAEANSRLLEARIQVVQAYDRAGRPSDAVVAADAALAAVAADSTQFDDLDEQINWLHNARAYALYELGRNEEARDAFRAAIGAGERGTPNVSQVINLSSMLVDDGRAEEALATLKTVGEPSAYGTMWVEAERACAAAQTGDAVMVDEALAYLRKHEDDNVSALQRGLICANKLDEAAALYLKRLADPDRRGDLLVRVQNWGEDPLLDLPFLMELRRREDAIRERPDVQAAIAEVGRVQDLPFPRF